MAKLSDRSKLSGATSVDVSQVVQNTSDIGVLTSSKANTAHSHTSSEISALDTGDITTGTLLVGHGGTGVTGAATGTGGVVLSVSPVLTGTVQLPTTAKVSTKGGVLYLESATDVGGAITISSANPSGPAPANGDQWIKYTP